MSSRHLDGRLVSERRTHSAATGHSSVDIDVNVVGFTLSGTRARLPLTAMAEATGGRYYEAGNGEELGRGTRGYDDSSDA